MSKLFLTIVGVLVALSLIWLALYLYSLTRSQFKDISRFSNQFEFIAHRGGSLEAPENTLAAFESAHKLHPRIAFELDVHFSRDKKIVVFHDETLERTTNGKGPLKEFSYEELKKLDAGFNFKNEEGKNTYQGKGVYIPLLEEVFEAFPNTKIIVEIKPQNQELAEAVLNLIKKYDRFNLTVIGSRHIRNVGYARTLDSRLLTTASVDEIYRTLMLANMKLMGLDKMACDILAIPEKSDNIKVLSDDIIKEAHKRGKKVYIWTVNEKTDMHRLYNMGVDGILTDRPKLLLEFLREQNFEL